MIERDPPFYFDVSCDTCSTGEMRIEANDFMEVVRDIKETGWTILKNANGEWEHRCPDC